MFIFLLFVISTIGMCHIICDSTLFDPIRGKIQILAEKGGFLKYLWKFLHNIVICYQCCGFWSGLFMGVVLFFNHPIVWFPCACGGSFLCVLAAQYLTVLEAQSIVLDDE